MLLSTLTHWTGSTLPEKETIKIIAEAGFDAYDISLFGLTRNPDYFFNGEDYVNQAKELRQYADSLGIVCNQSPKRGEQQPAKGSFSNFFISQTHKISSYCEADQKSEGRF